MKPHTLLLAAALVGAPQLARAQAAPAASPALTPGAPTPAGPTPDAVGADPARVAFEEGVAALQDERYADALAAFERSYRARRVASVALNLGVSLRAVGRLLEARQRFREFLALASPTQHARHDVEVSGYLAVIERQVGRVRLLGDEVSGCAVKADGRRVRPDGAGEVELDPGEHQVAVECDARLPAHQSVRVEPGETAELRLTLSRPPGWVFTRWWFWTGVAAVVGAGVAAGVVYSQQPADPPATNTGITIQTVSQ